MEALVYTRQSLDRSGAGAAVDRQREDCLKLCAERGWTVVREYSDNDVSATSSKPRPQYQAMLASVKRGEAKVLVAWHVDRLTRKLTELEDLIAVAERTGLRIATVTGDLDLATDSGRLVGRILASVARGEVERKGARQKRAQQQAAELGRPAGGRRPFGYGKDGLTVLDDEAAAIREGYQHLLDGGSLKSIARRWNELGHTTTMGNPWERTAVRNVLMNPRYAGRRTYRGQVVGPAAWSPVVEEETYELARALLSSPSRRTTKGTARKHLLPGIALCGVCEGTMATGHTRHGKRVYVCRDGKHISRTAQPIDDMVRDMVIGRMSQPDARDLLSAPTSSNLEADRAQARVINDRLDDLATGLEEGLLSLSSVRQSSQRLRAELAEVEARMHTAAHADVLGPLVASEDIEAHWNQMDLQQQRTVIDAIMKITLLSPKRGRNTFDPKTVKIEWRSSSADV